MRNSVPSLVMVLTVALAASCVPKEEKPAETKTEPAAPAGPPPEPARAALAIKPDAAYTIIGAASGKCLQLVGTGDGDTARTEIASCNGSKAQQFKFQSVPGNYWAIVNVLSSKCVDVSAFDMADDARVQQYQCNGGANQHWIVADAPGGNYRIVARHSGKVMDVAGGATADNTLVSQVTWKSAPISSSSS